MSVKVTKAQRWSWAAPKVTITVEALEEPGSPVVYSISVRNMEGGSAITKSELFTIREAISLAIDRVDQLEDRRKRELESIHGQDSKVHEPAF